jgi:hypothetical protein
MTDKILLKRSLVSGSIPTTASLEAGELAINVHDAAVYLKQSGSGQEVIRPLLTLDTDSTGDVLLTGSITTTEDVTAPNFIGDLLGTSSFAITASYAETTAAGAGFPFTGSAELSGSLTITGSSSTDISTGALVVSGGVGITDNVNIGGDVTILGLLTVVSQSTLYVTSSTLDIGTNKIVVNVDALNRFGGISVYDSGSVNHSGSLYWDSLNNRWIYETESGSTYDSAVILAGPTYTGNLGDENGLTIGTIPVAQTGHNLEDSPISVTGSDVTVSNELVVIGSVTASAFSGDGSQLTGIVTNLNVTGSEGGSGSINLKDDGLIVSGTNGIEVTVSGDTLTISGSDITLNNQTVGLGGTLDLTLEDIVTAGATTDTQVTLNAGAIISGILFTSGGLDNVTAPILGELVGAVHATQYDAAHLDYVIKDGSNYRTGTIMAVWDGVNITHTETSTTDIGDTSSATFDVELGYGFAIFKFSVDTGNWTVKTLIRAL